jgi:hypothetical protein
MAKGKQLRNSSAAELKIGIADLLDEINPEDLKRAIEWSGMEIVSNPKIAETLSGLLMGEKEVTKIVLGISVASQTPPPFVSNTLASGFIMGIALVLELLNKKEEDQDTGDVISEGSPTIQ